MSSYIQTIVQDDFVWRAIAERIAGQGVRSRTNFINIRCPMCNDYKRRCGVKNDTVITISCYNCGFKTGWSIGSSIGDKFRKFMAAIGMSENEISALNYKAFSYRATLKSSPDAALYMTNYAAPTFETAAMPPGAKSFSQLIAEECQEQDFLDAQAYMVSRGQELADNYEYYWSPSPINQMNRRVIIPCLFEGRKVGYSARAIDPNNNQRYHMVAPQNYLFNSQALTDPKRKFVILVEGTLDAIALDCVGLLGARLNPEQVAWIKSNNKSVIMLVDRDKRGQDLVDVALANHWSVSFAAGGVNGWWDPSVKDAAQAVAQYGSLWTLTSVIKEATNNKMAINYQRKKLSV